MAKMDNFTHAICFYFEKNLPLPITNVGQEYYRRQLWLQNLGVYDMAAQKATCFIYAEHYAKKSPNEVISCLDWYMQNKVPDGVRDMHVFMDNCLSQGKNLFILAYWMHLAQTRFKTVQLHFPIPGHSYLPIDRTFGNIEKKKRKKDKVPLPSVWVKLIREAQPLQPINVAYVQHPVTDTLADDGTPVVEVRDFKSSLDGIIMRTIYPRSHRYARCDIRKGLRSTVSGNDDLRGL